MDIYLDDNHFEGGIPTGIGKLISLKQLHLQSNQFSGTVPDSLIQLTNLESLYLNENQLEGDFPILGSTKLIELYFSFNLAIFKTMHLKIRIQLKIGLFSDLILLLYNHKGLMLF